MKIKIYQINLDRDTDNYAFMPYKRIFDFHGHMNPNSTLYDCVYKGDVDCNNLDDVYYMFNEDRPPEYVGRSLSVSDVIEIVESEKVEKGFYYVDSIGFKNVPFLPEYAKEMKNTKIKVVMVEPGKLARVTEIETGLDAMQHAVKGDIQAVYPFEDEVALVCNDDGKLIGLPLNRALYSEGEMYDIIAGPFFICAAPSGSDSYKSLNNKQIETYIEMFKKPERFYKVGDTITAVKYNPDRDVR